LFETSFNSIVIDFLAFPEKKENVVSKDNQDPPETLVMDVLDYQAE
jgi:hypothetical protein